MSVPDHLRINRQVYNTMAAAANPLCRPATDSELANPLATVDGAGWLGPSIRGRKLLCLAAGGGRQSALYAAAGADVTVVDLSGAMLELDRQVAAARGTPMRLIETSMDQLSMLADAEFDIVIHPVSTCYVPDVVAVYREVARVCRPGAIYISQHKSPVSLQASTEPSNESSTGRGYQVAHRYYRNEPIPPPASDSRATRRLRERGASEFLHRWESLIGGMCRSGFLIADFSEPFHAEKDAEPGSFADRAAYIPPYIRIKAIRAGGQTASPSIWIPGKA